MTIDEVIYYEKRCSERSDAFVGYTTKEHKQLAEWLEELKAIRQWKSDIMEDFCRYDVNSFEELISNTRKKTIDEFAEMLKEKYEEHKFDLCLRQNDYYSYSNSCMLFESYIDDIAEQLKAGDSNGT